MSDKKLVEIQQGGSITTTWFKEIERGYNLARSQACDKAEFDRVAKVFLKELNLKVEAPQAVKVKRGDEIIYRAGTEDQFHAIVVGVEVDGDRQCGPKVVVLRKGKMATYMTAGDRSWAHWPEWTTKDGNPVSGYDPS